MTQNSTTCALESLKPSGGGRVTKPCWNSGPHCSVGLANCSASGPASGLTSSRVPSGLRKRKLLTRTGSKGHSNPELLISFSTASGRLMGASVQFHVMQAATFAPNVRKVRVLSGPAPSADICRMNGLVHSWPQASVGQSQRLHQHQQHTIVFVGMWALHKLQVN